MPNDPRMSAAIQHFAGGVTWQDKLGYMEKCFNNKIKSEKTII
jgi:hypothetical protein